MGLTIFCKVVLTFSMNDGIFCKIFTVPEKIVMDLNSVMDVFRFFFIEFEVHHTIHSSNTVNKSPEVLDLNR